MKGAIRLAVKVGLAGLILAGIWWTVGGIEMPGTVSLPWLSASVVAFLAGTAVLTWAWAIYIRPVAEPPGPLRLYAANQAAGFSSLFLPSPAPSLARPLFLVGHLDPAAALGSTIVERINVFFVYGAAGLIAASLLVQAGALSWSLALVAAAAGLAGVGLVLRRAVARDRPEELERTWIGRIVVRWERIEDPSRLVHRSLHLASRILDDAQSNLKAISGQMLAIVALEGLTAALVARSLGIEAPMLTVGVLYVAASALAVLPVLPRGLGAVEGAGTALLAAVGVPPGQGLTLLLLVRAVTVAVFSVVGGAALYLSGVDVLDDRLEETASTSAGDTRPN